MSAGAWAVEKLVHGQLPEGLFHGRPQPPITVVLNWQVGLKK